MPSRNKYRRGRSRSRGRSGGADDMNINVPNDMEMQNAAPVNPLQGMVAPPAPQLIREVVNQNVHMQPNQPAQGALGLVFGPLPGAQLPGAQPGPHNPQGPIGGRKSRRRKSHRRKSHRRKSHRR